MNIFELINKILFKKKTVAEDLDHTSQQSLSPFMLNRWFSFYNTQVATFVNETFNKYSNIFDDKNDLYKIYYYFTPVQKFTKINYVKKQREQNPDTVPLTHIARNNCISERELKQYMDLFNLKLK